MGEQPGSVKRRLNMHSGEGGGEGKTAESGSGRDLGGGGTSMGIEDFGSAERGGLMMRAAPLERTQDVVRGWQTRERLVVFGGTKGDASAAGLSVSDREEGGRGLWRDSVSEIAFAGRDAPGGGSSRRGHFSARESGRSGQSEVSDLCDFSHAESEAEGQVERRGGTCEYLVRTVTRTLLELQAAVETEQDLETCNEAIAIIQEAAEVRSDFA